MDIATKVPEKLPALMYGLMKEAKRDSLVEFCENWGVDFETDYEEIKQWFKDLGIDL